MDRDKMKAYKIAYITDQLNLSTQEAEKFWPIYNTHEERLTKLRKEEDSNIRKLIHSSDQLNDISESEAKSIITSVSNIRDKAHAMNKEYFQKLRKVLPYKKILKLQVAERQFKRKLFERLKERRKKYREKRE